MIRDELGNLDNIITPRINIAGVETRGLDLELSARRATSVGTFRLDLRASKVLDFDVELSPFLDEAPLVGLSFAPPWRGSLRLGWEYGAHALSAGIDYIAERGSCFSAILANGTPNPQCAFRIASYTELDAQWRWKTSWNGELAIGGRNLNNRPPPHDAFGGYQFGLYDPNGRMWYLRYRQSF